MARLSTQGAPATPDESEEQQSVNGEGAMANDSTTKRKRKLDNMDSEHSKTPRAGAMGQAESREILEQRNTNIRRAAREAVKPKKGKLPSRRSDVESQAAPPGRRMLKANVLSNEQTFEVPSNEDNEVAFPKKKQVATKQQFSPLKRDVQHRRRRSEEAERQRQAFMDQQLGQAPGAADREHQADSENEAFEAGMNSGQPRRQEADSDVGGDDPAPVEDDEEEIQLGLSESRIQDEPSVEQPQQGSGGKRKRGRPRKDKSINEQAQRAPVSSSEIIVEQPATGTADAATPKRRPGRSTAEASTTQPESNDRTPDKSTRGLRAASGRFQHAHESPERSTTVRHAGQPSNAAPRTPDRRQKRSSVRAQTAISAEARRSSPQVDIDVEEQQSAGRQSEIIQPDALQPDIIDPAQVQFGDDEYQPAPVADEHEDDAEEDQFGDEEDEDEDEENDESGELEELDENEERTDATHPDSHRLYGHWAKIREMMREAAKHRGAKVRLKDDAFKATLMDCKRVTSTVRHTAVEIGPDELEQIVSECRSVVDRANAICRDGSAADSKKRGFHIFKHLVPALAKLLKAFVEAFERVDVDGAELRQISLEHLRIVLDLMHAIFASADTAFHGYKVLTRPIKREVHIGITIPLRDLCSDLEAIHRSSSKAQEAREQAEAHAQEIAAMDDEREQQVRRRKLESRNQEKWKSMNQTRFEVSINSSNLRKWNHLRSCPMTLVETDVKGQPYLPAHLRERGGEWTMQELFALQNGLIKYADTPSPLRSMVFENVMRQECVYGGDLAERNVLEIVVTANRLRDYMIWLSRQRGQDIDDWVIRVPRWVDPVKFGRRSGSADDVIDID